MKFDWRNNRDFLAGLFFIFIGAAAMFVSRDYPFGSALRMGPGYFPTVLGGIVVVFGIYVMIKGITNNEKVVGNWSLRALLVLPISVIVFGIMMEKFGFVPALIVLIYTSSFAGREFKFLEVTAMAVVMAIVCTGVFIYGLGLPYPLFSGH